MYVFMYPNVVFTCPSVVLMLFAVFTRASAARSTWVEIVEHMSVNAPRADFRSSFVASAPSLMERKHSSRSLTAALFRPLRLGIVCAVGDVGAACVGVACFAA